jgi:hypothetical protein
MSRLESQMRPLVEQLSELNELDELSDAQRADFDTITTQLSGMKSDYEAAQERATKSAGWGSTVDTLLGDAEAPRARGERAASQAMERKDRLGDVEIKSLAEYLSATREYKNPRNGQYNIAESVPVTALYPFVERKAAYLPANLNLSNGAQIFGPNTPRLAHPFLEMLRTVPWNELAVPYLAPVFTNNAAEVPIGTAKPESTNAGDFQQVMMRTIAHWKDVPRQIFRYFPAMRGVIEDELIGGVLAKAEDVILNGTGAGGNMKGILASVTQVGAGADMVTAILNGLGIIGTQGGVADAIVMNPSDYWALVAAGYTANKYNPIAGAGRIQSVQTVLTGAIAAGTTLIGDFSRAVALYVGEAATIAATEVLGIKTNIVTTRAEMDCVVLVEYPKFLVKTTAPIV